MLKAASAISVLTLVSRVLGFIRDVVTMSVLGVNWASGTFVLAWMVPNLLRRLFGEGALAAAFIPAFARRRKSGGDPAARGLLSGVTGLLIATLGGLTLLVVLGTFALPPTAWGLEGEDGVTAAQRGALLSELLRILFPFAVPICLLAVYAGALQSLGVFALPAAAPALLNLFWIGGLLIGSASADAETAEGLASICHTVAWSLLLGGFVQLLLGVLPLWRRGMLARPRWPQAGDGTGTVLRAMGPAALGLSIVQVNLLVDQTLAEYWVGPGAAAHVYLANRLLLFPHALVALPLATAVFPKLAELAASDSATERGALGGALSRAVRYTMFLALPATAGMILIADDLIAVAFQHGRFTAEDAETAALATALLVLGLPAIGLSQLYARAFFALGDTRTPARVAATLVVVHLGLVLVFVLGLEIGVAGFILATTCTSVLNAGWLLALLRRQATVKTPTAWGRNLRIAAAVALMVAALVVLELCVPTAGLSRWHRAGLGLGLPIAVGLVVYGVAAAALRVEELEALKSWIRRRRAR